MNDNIIDPISHLSENTRARVKGMITEVSRFDFYLACETCTSKLTANKWCDKCEAPKFGIPRFFVSILLDDGLGVLKLTFFGKNAEKLLGFNAKDVEFFSKMNIVELANSKGFVRKVARVYGRGLDVVLNVNKNEITDLLEGICFQFKFL